MKRKPEVEKESRSETRNGKNEMRNHFRERFFATGSEQDVGNCNKPKRKEERKCGVMGRYRSIIVHSMCLLLDGYYLQRAQIVFSGLRTRGWNTFAGEYAFLTQITHTLQTVFFALLLVFDLFELFIGRGKKEKRQLQNGDQSKRTGTSHYLHLIGDHGFSVLFVFTAVVGS